MLLLIYINTVHYVSVNARDAASASKQENNFEVLVMQNSQKYKGRTSMNSYEIKSL